MKDNEKQNYVLTEAQMYYYQNTDVGKGTGEIVDIDLYDLEFQEQIAIISDDAIEYINKKGKKHKISNKYKNTKVFEDFFSSAFKNIKDKEGILTTKETSDDEIKKILGL